MNYKNSSCASQTITLAKFGWVPQQLVFPNNKILAQQPQSRNLTVCLFY